MIGFQKYIIDNNISVPKFAKEIDIRPTTIWRWFNVDKVPEKYHETISNKFGIETKYINKIVNNIDTHQPRSKGFNRYKICGDYTILYVDTKIKEAEFEIWIDTEDLERIRALGYRWAVTRSKKGKNSEPLHYAITNIYWTDEDNVKRHTTITLHTIILNIDSNRFIHVNHKDHNTLNNMKYNLEIVPCSINSQLRDKPNTNSKTGVRNVHLVTKNGKEMYYVQIMKNGERFKWEFELNEFDEACEFARQKRIELFGKE